MTAQPQVYVPRDKTRGWEARNRAVTLRKIRRDNRVLGWRA